MKIVFSHQNYPAQFGAFGAYLAGIGWDVTFMTSARSVVPPPGCRLLNMAPHREITKGVHRFAAGLENAVINGQAFANTALAAKNKGLVPDIVVAHSGWGSGTFAKAVWPDCKFVPYVEWFYDWPAKDGVAPSRRQTEEDGRAAALTKNAPTLLDLALADLVFCPTQFQADQFPAKLRQDMLVMHDGIDTDTLSPQRVSKAEIWKGALPNDAEIITYATRGMEPHRGFPEFMRALAILQKSRPNLYAVIGGQDRVAYGSQLPEGETWKTRMLAELDLDLDRVHFAGQLPRAAYTKLLRASDVHVYLTVPFVLSWSMIEAMSIGTPLVASDVAPVREALINGVSADMIDHSDIGALVSAIERLLDDRSRATALGRMARKHAIHRYSSKWIFPARAAALSNLVKRSPTSQNNSY